MAPSSSLHASVSSSSSSSADSVGSIKQSLVEVMADTDRGRSASPKQIEELERGFQQLESTCNTVRAPARCPLVEGTWIVDFTTAPPPSNGQLGPFSGIARQQVSLDSGTYRNLLSVPPNDWLTASLDATWQEWDGRYLDDDDSQEVPSVATITGNSNSDDDDDDIGGSCWIVTFESLTLRLFGVPLFTKKFENVQRIWRTTYVDEETRIVRAGRTGRLDDEMTFYMTRE